MTNIGNQVTFEGEIREVKSSTRASQDKVGRLVIEFYPRSDTLDGLNKLHSTDKTVTVAIVENPDGYFNG